jgi:hypothetical protein
VIDLRSWPKKWNESRLGDFAILPDRSHAGPWPMLGMLAMGLVAGVAIGGYAVSQRKQMKRLAKQARRLGDQLNAMGGLDTVKPVAATSNRSNHRRKAKVEVRAK